MAYLITALLLVIAVIVAPLAAALFFKWVDWTWEKLR